MSRIHRGTTGVDRQKAQQQARHGATARQSRNLAARMGRWSAAHWKTATFGWLVFVLVAFALGGMVGTKSLDTNTPGPGESGRMDRILDAGFKQPAGESVLVQSRTLRRERSRLPGRRSTDVVARRLEAGRRPERALAARSGSAGQIAQNGHAALVEFEIRGDTDKAVDKIGPVLDTVADAPAAHPGSSSASSATRARSTRS